MSDCEETDFFWESWTSPGKRKRKKDSKKDKNKKRKNNITMKTDENIQKKKKKKKKEAMEGRKEKKKEKKKMKNRLALELDDSSSAQSKPTVKPEASNSCSNDKLQLDHLTQDSKKKTKRTKKVAFDLSPAYIRVKRPKFVSSSLQCPKESILLEAVRDRESCSQVTVTGHCLDQTYDNDSQCNSEDINSQDLFITQKTFKASPSEPSSGEASDKAVTTTPQMFTQRDELHTSVVQIKQHLEGSNKCPQDSHFHFQHHRKAKEHMKKPKTVQVLLAEEEDEEEEGLNKAHQNPKIQMELNTNLTKEKEVSCPVHIKQSVVNPYLDVPVDVNLSLDVAKSKKHSCTSSQQSITSTSTQTENFFTTELSSYLSFCQKSRVTVHFEDLKPLDLSLQQRARKDLNLHPSCSPDMKDVEVKKEPSGRQPCSASTHGKGETSLSPQSESEPKSADTTTSSEDNEPPCRTGKLDLTQVRAVQMRLNESFFFKTRGEGQSPRPASPLMKLAQSREVKSRKGH
ncbi:daf-12-interacting protein 1 [Siniperca chuatsi]|uniref:daf-12-interacting protein 1 n=1 Tax=Siniperca chuatsi TaxID=119488 RepID=UPI001CE202BE|nr:daf-12-interacting protein 1 [Siniperca chuatsi]